MLLLLHLLVSLLITYNSNTLQVKNKFYATIIKKLTNKVFFLFFYHISNIFGKYFYKNCMYSFVYTNIKT